MFWFWIRYIFLNVHTLFVASLFVMLVCLYICLHILLVFFVAPKKIVFQTFFVLFCFFFIFHIQDLWCQLLSFINWVHTSHCIHFLFFAQCSEKIKSRKISRFSMSSLACECLYFDIKGHLIFDLWMLAFWYSC
jgi:hypothetical protein